MKRLPGKTIESIRKASVGGIHGWQFAEKLGKYPYKEHRNPSFRYYGKEEGTAGNISAPEVRHKRNIKM